MTHFTADELISIGKSCIAADKHRMSARPEGTPRAAWREENPINIESRFFVRDTAFKTLPKRELCVTASVDASTLYNIRIKTTGSNPRLLMNINLRSEKANSMLSRFEKVEG